VKPAQPLALRPGAGPYDGAVGMRIHCKHYESRTYKSGDSVQKCNLDLAPEAPWRCPDECPGYAPRLVDVGWSYGSLSAPNRPAEPPGGLTSDAAALLDEAESIVNEVGPDILDEFRRLDEQRSKGWRGKLSNLNPKAAKGKRRRRK